MIKDITLGQFFPGDSFLHKMDPRMKIITSIMLIVLIFVASSLYSLLIVTVFSIFLVLLGKISFKTILKAFKPLLIIIIFTSIINIFWGKSGTLLFEWQFIRIYSGGLLSALFVSMRILLLVCVTSMMLSYTTSPISLTDGIESLLMPLSKIKIPVHDFAMMLTIAMRFIPILVEETDKIISAQKARGADFETGSLVRRAKALIPIFIPLFVSSIRHADSLATAMECRCYRGGEGRTKMKRLKLSVRDFVFFFLVVALLAGVILVNVYLGGYHF